MRCQLNGSPCELPLDKTLTALLKSQGIDATTPGIAVAVNRQIVPRTQWDLLSLHETDHIDVVCAAEGG